MPASFRISTAFVVRGRILRQFYHLVVHGAGTEHHDAAQRDLLFVLVSGRHIVGWLRLFLRRRRLHTNLVEPLVLEFDLAGGDRRCRGGALRDLTQPDAAAAMGIEQSNLSKLDNDKSLPSSDVLNRILDVFELEIGGLVSDLSQGARNQLRQLPDAVSLSVASARLRLVDKDQSDI